MAAARCRARPAAPAIRAAPAHTRRRARRPACGQAGADATPRHTRPRARHRRARAAAQRPAADPRAAPAGRASRAAAPSTSQPEPAGDSPRACSGSSPPARSRRTPRRCACARRPRSSGRRRPGRDGGCPAAYSSDWKPAPRRSAPSRRRLKRPARADTRVVRARRRRAPTSPGRPRRRGTCRSSSGASGELLQLLEPVGDTCRSWPRRPVLRSNVALAPDLAGEGDLAVEGAERIADRVAGRRLALLGQAVHVGAVAEAGAVVERAGCGSSGSRCHWSMNACGEAPAIGVTKPPRL